MFAVFNLQGADGLQPLAGPCRVHLVRALHLLQCCPACVATEREAGYKCASCFNPQEEQQRS